MQMARTHYETLGVPANATPDQIKSAYRKIVLKHHPDRSDDPKSVEIFMICTAAYEVLSDPERRRNYDELRSLEARRRAEQAQSPSASRTRPATSQPSRSAPSTPRPSTRTRSMTIEVTRLSVLYSRGRIGEAEKLAKHIIHEDRAQPIPYAILGDIARARGDKVEAAKMYAYAAQMDPSNPTYHQRHDELMAMLHTSVKTPRGVEQMQIFPVICGIGLVLLACIYVALSHETPIFPGLKLISSWTLGLIVMLFLAGVALGSSLCMGQLLDRFQSMTTTSMGKLAPPVALAFIALVNFWVAALMYVVLGFRFQAFDVSTSRVIGAVGAGTVVVAASVLPSGSVDFIQVLVWGGNVAYVGALCGWMVADSFRH